MGDTANLNSRLLSWHSLITWHHHSSAGTLSSSERSCHNSGSAVARHWAQSICSVGVHISWQLTHRDDGCMSLVKASSVPWVL